MCLLICLTLYFFICFFPCLYLPVSLCVFVSVLSICLGTSPGGAEQAGYVHCQHWFSVRSQTAWSNHAGQSQPLPLFLLLTHAYTDSLTYSFTRLVWKPFYLCSCIVHGRQGVHRTCTKTSRKCSYYYWRKISRLFIIIYFIALSVVFLPKIGGHCCWKQVEKA